MSSTTNPLDYIAYTHYPQGNLTLWGLGAVKLVVRQTKEKTKQKTYELHKSSRILPP